MSGSAFSTTNFDKFLAAQNGQPVQTNVPFHAGTAQYNIQSDYDYLAVDNSWIITSGGHT
jgi:hypothetical protein